MSFFRSLIRTAIDGFFPPLQVGMVTKSGDWLRINDCTALLSISGNYMNCLGLL